MVEHIKPSTISTVSAGLIKNNLAIKVEIVYLATLCI